MSDTELFEGMEYVGGYPVHHVASIFPMMGDSELQELADDIAENGQLEPIELAYLDEGATVEVLIDGRNRFRACELAGVSPSIQVNQGLYPDEVSAYIISKNLQRRHLTGPQRDALGAKYREAYFRDEAKRRQIENGKRRAEINNGRSEQNSANLRDSGNGGNVPIAGKKAAEEAATLVGRSPRQIESAAYVMEHDPETFEEIEKGETTASAAEKKVRQQNSPPPTPQEVEQKRQKDAERTVKNILKQGDTFAYLVFDLLTEELEK